MRSFCILVQKPYISRTKNPVKSGCDECRLKEKQQHEWDPETDYLGSTVHTGWRQL